MQICAPFHHLVVREYTMEVEEAAVRRFLTILFYKRAQRHLRTIATAYNLSAERLAELEERFLVSADCAPTFVPHTHQPVHSSSIGE